LKNHVGFISVIPISVSFLFLFLSLFMSGVVAQEVFFSPENSSAECYSPFSVEIYANATDFQGGQFNISYNPACVNVTGWSVNPTFSMGGWDSTFDGREYITFMKMLPPLTGLIKVGTLTINCEESCFTELKFELEDISKKSALFDSQGGEINGVLWTNGQVLCNTGGFDTPPTVNITSPVDGQVFTNNGAITVQGNSSDDNGVSKVELKLNEGGWMGVTGLIIWSKSIVLDEGENTICAKATDTIGQEGEMCINVTYNVNPCIKYDTNGIPGIQLSEAVSAITDYFNFEIDLQTVVAVIMCYFS